MARPSRASEIDAALLAQVAAHPRDLVKQVMARLGLSRVAVLARVEALVAEGYLVRDDNPTRPSYALGPHRRAEIERPLAGLEEHLLWQREVRPLLAGLPANVLDLCHHGFTEMVNNAIDHSAGSDVRVLIDRNGERVQLVVADDGVGIFHKIARHLELPDERLALLELAKGKLTTDPQRHSGEGVFFTSRMFDRFQIVSGDLVFDHDHTNADDWLFDVDDVHTGTTVLMEIAAAATRTPKEVFDAYSSGPDEYAFARTVVPVRLAKVGDENLVSRSQAKRLLQRVDRFRVVVLDFDEVASIGQAFADEVFRVFANAHPDIELIPMHASAEVQQMIRRAQVARAEGEGQGSLF